MVKVKPLTGNTVARVLSINRKWINDNTWFNSFNRLKHRESSLDGFGSTINDYDLKNAGYPSEEVDIKTWVGWVKLHELCEDILLKDESTRSYVWFGKEFFFVDEETHKAFKSILLLI